MVGKSLKKWWPVFVLPTLAAFIIGFLWPFIWGIYLSFCKFSTVKDVVLGWTFQLPENFYRR